MSSMFGRKVMIVLAADIKDICYHEIVARTPTMSAARYVEFLKKLTVCWRGNLKLVKNEGKYF